MNISIKYSVFDINMLLTFIAHKNSSVNWQGSAIG
ncbi:MAG: hypothetical protein ACI9HY_002037, partial [Planctomycetaceae bacterium]